MPDNDTGETALPRTAPGSDPHKEGIARIHRIEAIRDNVLDRRTVNRLQRKRRPIGIVHLVMDDPDMPETTARYRPEFYRIGTGPDRAIPDQYIRAGRGRVMRF